MANRDEGIAPPRRLEALVAGVAFQRFTYALVALSAAALGVEAVPSVAEPMAPWLEAFFLASTAWFVLEIALRIHPRTREALPDSVGGLWGLPLTLGLFGLICAAFAFWHVRRGQR